MSTLQYFVYPGYGETGLKAFNYSQAVRVPPGEIIEISGQGGWIRETDEIHTDLRQEINQAFENVDYTITHAGGKGMSSVYKLKIFYAPCSDEAMSFTAENMKKWFPSHAPTLTAVGIEKLGLPGMRIEIEAWAHLGEIKTS